MENPDRKDLELNEVRWWSNWARLTWLPPTGYLLASDELRESFFNRAGALTCTGVNGLAEAAEKKLADRRMDSTITVFDSCARTIAALEDSGYKPVDTMVVLMSKGPIEATSPAHATIISRPSPRSWVRAYLDAFYEDQGLSASVTPIVSHLSKAGATTLLEARIKDETAGVLAIFRTKGLAGVYCVGTIPKFRKLGVAGILLAKARAIAMAEGRKLVLQSLASEGSKRFYLNRGFAPLYSKQLLTKENSNVV